MDRAWTGKFFQFHLPERQDERGQRRIFQRRFYRPWIPSTLQASRPISGTTLTVRGSAPTHHAIGNWREPTRNNGQTADHQKPELTGRFKIRTSAMTSGYYRTSSPVTALPMIIRWISDVPSKMVKILASRCQRSTG
jgi:hypothetical protein